MLITTGTFTADAKDATRDGAPPTSPTATACADSSSDTTRRTSDNTGPIEDVSFEEFSGEI
jgi:hypothetical protein